MSDLPENAKALMNNPAFRDALESAQQSCINAAMACDVKDDEGRRRFLDAAKIVGKVASHLAALIQAAKTGDEVDHASFYEERARSRWALFN